MRCACVRSNKAALTLIEVLVVVATAAIAAAVLIPAFGSKRSSRQVSCVNNLKQVGQAFLTWSRDHETGFPWTVPEKQGGTLEYATASEVFRHFQIASNELNSPDVLICPQDAGRKSASSFDRLSNQNLSYFVGLDADPAKPNTILSGDRALSTNHAIISGVVNVQYPKSAHWAPGLHYDAGHLVWTDGSVETVDQLQIRKAVQDRRALPARLSIP
jgi:type II secretory pathway pseudopilin PulG